MAIEKNKIANPKRILAIKFSSIGDIVLTTSPIKTLKKTFPSAKIDFLTREDFVPLIEGNKYIDKVIPFNRDAGFFDLIKTGNWINNSSYDFVVDFHNSLRSSIILSRIRRIEKRKLKKPRWKRFLLFRFRNNKFSENFNQLQLLHKPINEWMKGENYPLPKLFISNEEKIQTIQLLGEHGIKKKFITIIPGAAWTQKVWYANEYGKLIKNIRKYDFVILGGKNDTICTNISKLNKSVLNLQGETNIRESMAIIANSELVIGADTGFIHAAEALGKNVVMILGPTSRETGAGVNRDLSVNIENNEIWCRPCSQNGKRKCYRDEQYCMTTISEDYAFNKINGMLN